ncbi:uncharacterized protein LOC107270040 [Cephus cinctus]|uniref:L antigen family member 3 n=1 Tax=Cephus cinctus TaxID=211228 RepID=A0AAJ7C3D6_CEPCN|nr:uncharacterized protein LOC107270040 [Cephus cinctus]XP_024943207.1 uncharacterized protein LOC107270040 [Cephus cinctus]
MNNINVNVTIPFPTTREADVAYQVLRVDNEPKRSGVTKQLTVEGNLLTVIFYGQEARKVRVGLTSFFESLILVTETMKELGPPESEYSYY